MPMGGRYVLVNQVASDVAWFDFGGRGAGVVLDVDGDGLPDDWERRWFGGLGADPRADADADGFTNRAEFEAGTDPARSDDQPNLDGVVARWRGEESLRDAVGNHEGVWVGEAAYGPGRLGKAMRIGEGRFVRVPGAEELRPKRSATVAAWIGPTGLTGNSAPILAIPSPSRGIPALQLSVSVSGPRWTLSSAAGTTTEGPSMAWDGDHWHHVAGSWDGRWLRVFVDGGLVHEVASGFAGPLEYADGADVFLGHDGHTGWLDGWVDEVVLADRALSADQIRWLAGGTGGSGLPEPEEDLRIAIEWRPAQGEGGVAGVRVILPRDAPPVVIEGVYALGGVWQTEEPRLIEDGNRRVLEVLVDRAAQARFFRLRRALR